MDFGKVKQQIAFSTGKGDVLHIKLRETVIRNQFSKILWNATRTIQSAHTGPELAYMFSDLASRVYSGENRGGIPSRKCGRTSLRVQLCKKCNKCDDDCTSTMKITGTRMEPQEKDTQGEVETDKCLWISSSIQWLRIPRADGGYLQKGGSGSFRYSQRG